MNYVPVATKEIKLDQAERFTDATFTAEIARPEPGPAMYRLALKLAIRLERSYPSSKVRDLDGKEFPIVPWKTADWQTYVINAKQQAGMWNNQFWLAPPASVTEYDWVEKTPQRGQKPRRFRPYFTCQLDVDFFASRSNSDRVIQVYNLDTSRIPNADGGTFRSDALHYDSLDGKPWATPYLDDHGNPIKTYVIAHEIGHALGQPHIGVMRKTAWCVHAMRAKGLDGQNELACYGVLDMDPSLAMNVMGAGGAFSVDNARSWIWAMHVLRGARKSQTENWKVFTSRPATDGEWIS